jgi:hypothetical protein
MNKINKVIEDSNKELVDTFCVMIERAGRDDGESPEDWQLKLESFISQTIPNLLTAIEEEVEVKKMYDTHAEPLGAFEIKPKYDHLDIFGYNTALSDIQLLLK